MQHRWIQVCLSIFKKTIGEFVKLVWVTAAGDIARLGVRTDDTIVRLDSISGDLPQNLHALLDGGECAFDAIARSVKNAPSSAVVTIQNLEYALPIANPSKIICLGLNYADHAREGGHDKPEYPSFLMRGPSSLVAHGKAIEKPEFSDTLDYEVELMVIIGKRCEISIRLTRWM